jgi:hypothetical protein
VGGDHPKADSVCARLRVAGGDLTKIEKSAPGCAYYEAINYRVFETGTYDGRPVDYTVPWNRSCILQQFGDMFSFAF